MVYIPFASLLGLQALFESFAQSRPELALTSIAPVHYIDPRPGGGSLLDKDSGGLGEPLNVIISGLSSPGVISDGGFLHFANGNGFGIECFGAHRGAPQTANLGDGRGWVNQTIELRDDYGNPDVGSCWESLVGGNHLRMWRQTTTGALFLAVSEEDNVIDGHTIRPDGYNLGRKSLVKSALNLKSYKGVNYKTTAQDITGLLAPGSKGVNHGIATDGIVTLLVVTIVP
ncbi:hypothetical protein F5148DRAFT_374026 [Russula earlei]|uniref:Uncharacterized protein n=1 Tax=Russula earlei TaxID=71964 RepID=A0ACC0UHX6_9AGAM|nr:hypothetical protein F5148DRAFT_374026 [Russula earlei]